MEQRRLHKIARLIQKELGEIFRKETAKTTGTIISVTDVRPSQDLSQAKVYLSIFPSEKGKEIVKNINKQGHEVRFALGKQTGSQLRVIPELTFFLDETLDYMQRIDELLAEDKKEE